MGEVRAKALFCVLFLTLLGNTLFAQSAFDEANQAKQTFTLRLEEAETGSADLETKLKNLQPLISAGYTAIDKKVEQTVATAEANTTTTTGSQPAPTELATIQGYHQQTVQRQIQRLNPQMGGAFQQLLQVDRLGGERYDTQAPVVGQPATPAPVTDRIMQGTFRRNSPGNFDQQRALLNWASARQAGLTADNTALRTQIQESRANAQTIPPPPAADPIFALNLQLERLKEELTNTNRLIQSQELNIGASRAEGKRLQDQAWDIDRHKKEIANDWNANVMPNDNKDSLAGAVSAFEQRHSDVTVQRTVTQNGDITNTKYHLNVDNLDQSIDNTWKQGQKHLDNANEMEAKANANRLRRTQLQQQQIQVQMEIQIKSTELVQCSSNWRVALDAVLRHLSRLNQLRQEHDVILSTTTQLVNELSK